MIDWQDKVDRSSLTCSASGQIIAPGETFYSCLVFVDGHFGRVDFNEMAWEDQEPQSFLSWWRLRRAQEKADQGPQMVNATVLLTIFHDLKASLDRDQQCFAWLISLLLMRKKKLRYLDLLHENGEVIMLVEDKVHKAAHRIRDPRMTAAEEERVKADLENIFQGGLTPQTTGDEVTA